MIAISNIWIRFNEWVNKPKYDFPDYVMMKLFQLSKL